MKNSCPHCEYAGPPESFQKFIGNFDLYHVSIAACPRCGELLAFNMPEYMDWELFHYEGAVCTEMFLREIEINDFLELEWNDLDSLWKMQQHIKANPL